MKFVISRQHVFKHEYWRGAALDIWSTEVEGAYQFDTFNDAYETMIDAKNAFVTMLVEQFHQHVETKYGPLPSMYKASPTAILVTVPNVRGVLGDEILFDLEVIVPSPLAPEEKKGE